MLHYPLPLGNSICTVETANGVKCVYEIWVGWVGDKNMWGDEVLNKCSAVTPENEKQNRVAKQ